jgi:hypothetical protein
MICLYCDNAVHVIKHQLCSAHYSTLRRNGDPLSRKNADRTGIVKDPLYSTWTQMKRRCYGVNTIGYGRYGERGIKVCDRWLGQYGFENFKKDMGSKPSSKHSLDRIDNDSNYEPSNCRWATSREQNSNRSNNNKIVGVYKHKGRKRWDAYITVDGKRTYKKFNSEQEAIDFRKYLAYVNV